jgi:hypothetical protein
MSEKSRYKDIYVHLKSHGFNVFTPGTKSGTCTEKYLVLKKDGAAEHTSFSTMISYYSVLVYVPAEKYSTLDEYVEEVKECMKKLKPLIYPYGQEDPSFYDDSIKAHMVSIMYKNYKKM